MRLCAKAQPANMSLIHRRTTSAFPFVLYRDTDTKVNDYRMAGYPSRVLTFLYEEKQRPLLRRFYQAVYATAPSPDPLCRNGGESFPSRQPCGGPNLGQTT